MQDLIFCPALDLVTLPKSQVHWLRRGTRGPHCRLWDAVLPSLALGIRRVGVGGGGGWFCTPPTLKCSHTQTGTLLLAHSSKGCHGKCCPAWGASGPSVLCHQVLTASAAPRVLAPGRGLWSGCWGRGWSSLTQVPCQGEGAAHPHSPAPRVPLPGGCVRVWGCGFPERE